MSIDELLKILKIKYRSINIYYIAFTHTTFANEQKEKKYQSYERLEFLGDVLLSWMVSRRIYLKYNLDEGKMSLLRASVIRKDSLAKYTRQLKLDMCLITGKGANHLNTNNGVLSDIFESFIAAIYLDLGYAQVEKILNQTIYKDLKETWDKENKDYKTLLQEQLQSENGKKNIKYVSFKKSNKFISQVVIGDMIYGTGTADNKKNSQQEAARTTLSLLKSQIEIN